MIRPRIGAVADQATPVGPGDPPLPAGPLAALLAQLQQDGVIAHIAVVSHNPAQRQAEARHAGKPENIP